MFYTLKMNDPHVTQLTYRIHWIDAGHSVAADAPKLDVVLAGFNCELFNGRLTARPQQHYPDADSAAAELEPPLRAWEAEAELENGLGMEFVFEAAAVTDLAITPGTISASAIGSSFTTGTASIALTLPEYPQPSRNMKEETSLGHSLRMRWRSYLLHRESMLAAAYWILTRIQQNFGGRQAAAHELNVSSLVLGMLGRLTTIDDPVLGRKAGGGERRRLTQHEIDFVRTVTPRLILRVNELAMGRPASQLSIRMPPPVADSP